MNMSNRKSYWSLLGFLVVVVGGGWLIGYFNRPGAWYMEIAKPGFTPPGWAFGPVWTVLYVLIAIAGWRTLLESPRSARMLLWWAQLAINFSWSPIFFSAHQIGAALLVLILLLAANVSFVGLSWRTDRIAAWLFVPYVFWTAFAFVLNAAIFSLN
jgi:tryptophan-rich sensory protein